MTRARKAHRTVLSGATVRAPQDRETVLRRSTALLLAGVLSLPVAGAALPTATATATAAAAAVAEPPLSSVTMVSDQGD